jgi:hypothetical protein
MTPAANAKKPRRKPGTGRKGQARAAPRRGARAGLNPIQRLILSLGRTLVGILPRAGRIRAANDPKA